jgi:hypothetical protein
MNKNTKSKRYTDEFKIAAVRRVREEGHSNCEVANRHSRMKLSMQFRGMCRMMEMYASGYYEWRRGATSGDRFGVLALAIKPRIRIGAALVGVVGAGSIFAPYQLDWKIPAGGLQSASTSTTRSSGMRSASPNSADNSLRA